METILHALEALDVPYPTRRVYVDLLEHGDSPARAIAQRLGMTRPSVYDQLRTLANIGLVHERDEGKSVFGIHDPRDLERLLAERTERIAGIRRSLPSGLAELARGRSGEGPRIRFFEGRDGLVRLYRDMLWEDGVTILSVWPHDTMSRVFGREELEAFNKKRIKGKIRVRSIWPHGAKEGRDYVWRGGDWGVDRRVAPKDTRFNMSYSVYGETVSFVSSEKESFGFSVRSEEFALLMRAQFEVLWFASHSCR